LLPAQRDASLNPELRRDADPYPDEEREGCQVPRPTCAGVPATRWNHRSASGCTNSSSRSLQRAPSPMARPIRNWMTWESWLYCPRIFSVQPR